MYDNLDFILSKDKVLQADLISSVPACLDKITSDGVSEYGHYVNGLLGSLKVKISERGVTIKDSSLCKYYLGDNFKTLSRGDTKKAVELISDKLHLPFSEAKITRIDIAQNIVTQYPENVYYPYLGEAQYYNRLEQNNGLYYNNNKRQLVFYGKVHEQKLKKQPIPDLYNMRNVLRYEMRFRKRLTQQFNVAELTAEMLYDETFYYKLVKRWKSEYFKIQKINSKLNTMKPTGSTKDLGKELALLTILELGQSKILKLVDEWQLKNEITKKQAYDHRRYIKALTSKVSTDGKNDLIDELNKKIIEASRIF